MHISVCFHQRFRPHDVRFRLLWDLKRYERPVPAVTSSVSAPLWSRSAANGYDRAPQRCTHKGVSTSVRCYSAQCCIGAHRYRMRRVSKRHVRAAMGVTPKGWHASPSQTSVRGAALVYADSPLHDLPDGIGPRVSIRECSVSTSLGTIHGEVNNAALMYKSVEHASQIGSSLRRDVTAGIPYSTAKVGGEMGALYVFRHETCALLGGEDRSYSPISSCTSRGRRHKTKRLESGLASGPCVGSPRMSGVPTRCALV